MEDMNKQSKRFYEILDVIKNLHDQKRHDYGANEDIFANFRLSELSGIPAWQGSVVRMGDKYARISNFIKKGDFKFKEVNNRSRVNFGDSSEGGNGGGGASNINSLESNGLKKGQNWSDGD